MTPFWILYKSDNEVLQRFNYQRADNSKVAGLAGSHAGKVDAMKRIIEYLWSCSKVLLHKIGVEVTEYPGDEAVRLDERFLRIERRRESRHPKISPCSYGLMRSVDRDGGLLEEGQGAAVNESPTGLRLLLGVAPSKGQLLEIQTGHSALGRAICLAVVCWTKPLREDGQGALYLVGCRVNFDATHGLKIQPRY
jgi:hypothetical protein